MKIILTNDDGIDAPGLAALFDVVPPRARPVVVAPKDPMSWISHRVTTRSPLRVVRAEKDRFSVDGTPADCARIALKNIAADASWLLSGINPGANLGSDVYNSGTVAAAREAAILGCRSVAISQYMAKDQKVDWSITASHAGRVLNTLLSLPLAPGHFWNVNLPHPLSTDRFPETVFCGLDPHPHQYEFVKNGEDYCYRGSIHDRPRDLDKDVAVCFGGSISVTRIAIGTTDYPSLKQAKEKTH